MARNFANGIAFGKAVPGIIMSKTFKVGYAVPNPHTLGESEWLVPGVVYGAKVEYVLPRSGQNYDHGLKDFKISYLDRPLIVDDLITLYTGRNKLATNQNIKKTDTSNFR